MALTGADILNTFHIYVDDASRLSIDAEIDLMQLAYDKILDSVTLPYNIAKYTGTMTSAGILLPENFRLFKATKNERGRVGNYIFVNQQSYLITDEPMGLVDSVATAWVDWNTNYLYVTHMSGPCQFLYNYTPESVTVANYTTWTSILPDNFPKLIAYQMCKDFYPIDGVETSASGEPAYSLRYKEMMQMLQNRIIRNKLSTIL